MTLPASWVQIPIIYSGDYYPSGDSLAGKRIVVEPLSPVVADGEIAFPKKLTLTLDENGALPDGTTLPSCDNDGVGGVYYRISEKWSGGRDPFNVLIPTTGTVNLATAAPVVDADLDLVSVLGLPAVVAAQAAQAAAEAAEATAATSATAASDSADAASASAASASAAAAQLGQWQQITQAAYNALSPPPANTLYIIVG